MKTAGFFAGIVHLVPNNRFFHYTKKESECLKSGRDARSKQLVAALILNTVWLFFSLLLCDSKYEISDDFVIASILSGGYGEYTAFTPYVNICLSKVLKILYLAIPDISWFFVYLIILGFLSFTSISWIIFQKSGRWSGVIISLLLLIFFADDIYLLTTYTKTASLAALSGGALILHSIWEREENAAGEWISGSLILIGGGLLRKESFLLACPFLAFCFFRYFLQYCKKNQSYDCACGQRQQKKNMALFVFRNMALCMIPIGVILGAVFLDHCLWQRTESGAFYYQYNKLRSDITDTAGYGFNSIDEQFEAIGLDETDYNMIKSWNFQDVDIYPAEKLATIAAIKRDYRDQEARSLSSVIKRILDRNSLGYWPCIGIIVIFVSLCFADAEKCLANILLLAFSFVILLYFYWIDRVVYRVEYGVFFGCALQMILWQNIMDISKTEKRSFLVVTACCFLIHFLVLIPDFNYRMMTDEEYADYRYRTFIGSADFKPTKYWIHSNERRAYANLISLIENDDEHYYLFDFATTIQLTYFDYNPWLRTPKGFYENFSYLGGITSYYPGNQAMWEKQHIISNNPYKSLINENILVVDNSYYENKFQYLKKYYYPNARKELYNNVDGFHVWKYSLQSGWLKISDKWYYFDIDGKKLTGWQEIDEQWYYFDSDGIMLENTSIKLGNTVYQFDDKGVCMNR